jgi:hypothetical protein
MNQRIVLLAVAGAVLLSAGTATAADIRLGGWLFRFNERAQISISAPLSNEGPTDSGPIAVRLWATSDPRSSIELSEGAFLLVEEVLGEGLTAGQSVEINTDFLDIIEEPEAGQYNIALTVEENAFDANPAILSFAGTRLDFPLPQAPTATEVRRRVASQVPCGALFVQFSLATFVGLSLMKRVRVRPRTR